MHQIVFFCILSGRLDLWRNRVQPEQPGELMNQPGHLNSIRQKHGQKKKTNVKLQAKKSKETGRAQAKRSGAPGERTGENRREPLEPSTGASGVSSTVARTCSPARLGLSSVHSLCCICPGQPTKSHPPKRSVHSPTGPSKPSNWV